MKIEELEKIINKIDKREINKFLVKVLMRDENVLNCFRSDFINYFPKITKMEYKSRVWSAIRNAGGNDGYIDYNETQEYTHAMYIFIHENKRLIEFKNYESAFDIVEVILDSIPEIDIDDSNGSTGEVANDCIEIIEDILGYVLFDDNVLGDRILKYILNEIKNEKLYNYGIELYSLLNYYIDEKKNILEIKNVLQAYLETNQRDCWIKNKYIEILKVIEKSTQKIKTS